MIPKILHHVWPGTDPFRPKFHAWRASWLRHHPDWTLMFWRLTDPTTGQPPNDSRVAEILSDPAIHFVTKSDILRLHALREYGGLYVDTDFECFRPFDDLLDDPRGFFAAKEPFARPLSPALMASVQGHAFVRDYLDAAIKAVHAAGPEESLRSAVALTGPGLMTRLGLSRSDVTLHPVEWFYPDHAGRPQYAKHHWNGSKDPEGWAADAARVKAPPCKDCELRVKAVHPAVAQAQPTKRGFLR